MHRGAYVRSFSLELSLTFSSRLLNSFLIFLSMCSSSSHTVSLELRFFPFVPVTGVDCGEVMTEGSFCVKGEEHKDKIAEVARA